jgi:glucokinase
MQDSVLEETGFGIYAVNGPNYELGDFTVIVDLTSQTVYECAIKGDKIANRIFEYTGQILGEALANFVMFSSPEVIVLFGGLTKAGDLILNPTVEAMEANLIKVFKNKVKVVFSNLQEADAAILGASALVWDE